MPDVHLDDVGIAIERRAPHRPEELALRHLLVGVVEEVRQHLHLARGQFDGVVAPEAASPQRIQSEGLSVRATEEAVAQLQGGLRPGRTPRRSTDDARHERLDHYATALTSRLDTAVKITLGARKGRIAIDFTTVEDLNRIMDLIQGGQDGKGKGKKS